MFMRAVLASIAFRLDAVRVDIERVEQLQHNSLAHVEEAHQKDGIATFPGRGADHAPAGEPWEGPLQIPEPGSRFPLITGLDPPPGKTYRFTCAERYNFLDANEYDWVLDSVEEDGQNTTVNRTVAELRGSWTSGMFGHRRTRVSDANTGGALFDIRNVNSAWNPVVAHWTWRVVVPEERGSIYLSGAGDVFFSIQEDLVGDVSDNDAAEWHIYRGHVSDNDKVYYCHAKGAYRYECLHSKRHIGRPPVAVIYEQENSATNMREMFKDTYEVTVHENEDAALLLAVATVIDMTKDWSASATSDHEGGSQNDAPAEEESGADGPESE